jgi:hypothetical protein
MKKLILFSFVVLSPMYVFAEKSSNSAKLEDIDTHVIDAKLRAQSGSKSKWSSTINFTYFGASLKDPMSEDRPNLSGRPVAPPVRASGNVGIRYRLEPGESLYFATGFSRPRPLSGHDQDKMEVASPHFLWNTTTTLSDIQLSSNWMAYWITSDYLRETGQRAMLAYSVTALANPNHSRLDAGISLTTWYTSHDKDTPKLRTRQRDYGFGLSPMVQFRLIERLKLYTSLSLFDMGHIRANQSGNFTQSDVTQNVGAAISVTRDIFLSPHLTFLPEDISSKKTEVNLSATMNVF